MEKSKKESTGKKILSYIFNNFWLKFGALIFAIFIFLVTKL